MKIWRLLLRLVVGALFVGHGTQKLFGPFGGHGLEATAQAFDGLGLRPGKLQRGRRRRRGCRGGALLAAGFLRAGSLTT